MKTVVIGMSLFAFSAMASTKLAAPPQTLENPQMVRMVEKSIGRHLQQNPGVRALGSFLHEITWVNFDRRGDANHLQVTSTTRAETASEMGEIQCVTELFRTSRWSAHPTECAFVDPYGNPEDEEDVGQDQDQDVGQDQDQDAGQDVGQDQDQDAGQDVGQDQDQDVGQDEIVDCTQPGFDGCG